MCPTLWHEWGFRFIITNGKHSIKEPSPIKPRLFLVLSAPSPKPHEVAIMKTFAVLTALAMLRSTAAVSHTDGQVVSYAQGLRFNIGTKRRMPCIHCATPLLLPLLQAFHLLRRRENN